MCSMTRFIAARYRARSHWARDDRTAGPREALSVRNWIVARSVTPTHLAAEGVDLADQVPLGRTADGGIARHLADAVEAHASA